MKQYPPTTRPHWPSCHTTLFSLLLHIVIYSISISNTISNSPDILKNPSYCTEGPNGRTCEPVVCGLNNTCIVICEGNIGCNGLQFHFYSHPVSVKCTQAICQAITINAYNTFNLTLILDNHGAFTDSHVISSAINSNTFCPGEDC